MELSVETNHLFEMKRFENSWRERCVPLIYCCTAIFVSCRSYELSNEYFINEEGCRNRFAFPEIHVHLSKLVCLFVCCSVYAGETKGVQMFH